ncbi:MAG: sulfurtransferase TusA family protein [Gammaproteobacteria bacterium]|nr:sulfurtransferase TusA family protein [Gammaproteobacteria bacterium]
MNQPADETETPLVVDLSGLNCPLPVLKTKAALAREPAGTLLEVVVTHPDSVREFEVLCKADSLKLEAFIEQDGRFIYRIRKLK